MDEPKKLGNPDRNVKRIVETSSIMSIKNQPNGCHQVKRANGVIILSSIVKMNYIEYPKD